MSEEPSALEARGLTKRYRDVVALSECSFQLPAHRIIALAGANGAGKSTLMSIAAGLLPATSGEVLAGGQRIDPHRRPRPADTAHRVAILAQDKPLYRDFTVAGMPKFSPGLLDVAAERLPAPAGLPSWLSPPGTVLPSAQQ